MINYKPQKYKIIFGDAREKSRNDFHTCGVSMFMVSSRLTIRRSQDLIIR